MTLAATNLSLPHRLAGISAVLRPGEVTAICGPAIPPEKINVNYLQDVVLKLKYSISTMGN